ncbi:MAG: HEAT repeat domain-containing protein [Acidobacteriota bacterium]
MNRTLATAAALAALLVASAGAQTPTEWQDVIRNLRHPNPQTRIAALDRLNQAGYVLAAEAVAPLVADPDDRVQLAAIDTELTFFLADRVNSGKKNRAQLAFEAGPLARSAVRAPPAVLDRLITAMRDENALVRFDAIHALGVIAESPLPAPQVKALAAELDHYDPTIRAATARVLGRLGARESADQVAVALVDSSPVVRLFATEALGVMRDARSAQELRDQLAKARGDMLGTTLLALARIGLRDDIGLFRQRLADRAPLLRRAAAEGLGRAGDAGAVPLLEPMLKNDRDDSVRLAAAFGLQRLGQTQSHVIAWMLGDEKTNAQARDYLIELGPVAVPGIQQAFKSAKDSRHRATLVQLLGVIGTSDAMTSIEPLLKDPDDRVRQAAIWSMTRLRRG